MVGVPRGEYLEIRPGIGAARSSATHGIGSNYGMSFIFSLINKSPMLSAVARKIARRFPRVKSAVLKMSYAAALWQINPLAKGGKTYDKSLKTVILCVHDGSFTGAPVLGWNLARGLSETHNVICIMLHGGKLAADFMPFCVGFVVPMAGSIADADPQAFANRILRPIRSAFGLDYVVANSVESEIAVSAAAILDIPSLSLIHEFAEYTYPPRLIKVLNSADRVVFSSQLLASSARGATGLVLPHALIAPQGKCLLPAHDNQQHSSHLASLLADHKDGETFLCIGCGHVQIRKGVDLFIAAATQVLAKGVKAKFVWVGDGYDPERDYFLSVWLKDQIQRGGHAEGITILPALSAADLNTLYERADAMFLSSRLDPLPNVAIDALSAGVPVVCFDNASGFSDYFQEDAMLQQLVVPYFDFIAAAEKIYEVAMSRELRDNLSQSARALAKRRFDMDAYVKLLLDCLEEVSTTPKNHQ